MPDLSKLPHRLDAKAATCQTIVETPKGRRSKFDYDRKSRAFRLKAILPDGMSFPLDFGFVPSTLCDDGDPLDVMILIDEPASVGALLDVRLIGAIEAQEVEDGRKERNDRLLAVAAVSHLYAKLRTPDDLPEGFIDNLTQFWVNKDKLEGKTFSVLGVRGPKAAVELIKNSARAFKKSG
jgi:inorganic pyrophosphatase